MLFYIGLIFLLGIVLGSFASVFTYRFPRGIDFVKGRSFCDKCGKRIRWFDNIPLVSYLLLGGKCRDCSKKISPRYPLIEVATALIFLALFGVSLYCPHFSSPVCYWQAGLGVLSYPFIILVFLLSIFIFIIDFEKRIIPDELIFISLLLVALFLILGNFKLFYLHLFSALLSAFTLLFLHLVTKGKGMGLGDVKYALVPGLFLGWPLSLVWLFVSFLTGAIVAIILILARRAHGKDKIAFGPFLVFSFVIVALFGNVILKWIVF